jgi:hypothetical protein
MQAASSMSRRLQGDPMEHTCTDYPISHEFKIQKTISLCFSPDMEVLQTSFVEERKILNLISQPNICFTIFLH